MYQFSIKNWLMFAVQFRSTDHTIIFFRALDKVLFNKNTGPSCSKLTMLLVNVSLKL